MSFFSFLSKTEDNLSGSEFKAKFQASPNAVLLDVRTPGEVSTGKLPGAINMNIQDSSFQNKAANLSKEKEYFVYCRSGMRSANAVKVLKSLGLQAYNLEGGIGAWPN
jgi:rhodanese-related sulfurtransferase